MAMSLGSPRHDRMLGLDSNRRRRCVSGGGGVRCCEQSSPPEKGMTPAGQRDGWKLLADVNRSRSSIGRPSGG
ncbi:hypothetical protein L2E82_14576 [Cichorium intybus]|uniref:Uncharacterized protein n=1 Tax=Cichorium intybus TaxID=13427 RepID=A0ACB9F0G4_CICIN|nr:hypothetical protein L2E82_14576 [Cichorium intybus]